MHGLYQQLPPGSAILHGGWEVPALGGRQLRERPAQPAAQPAALSAALPAAVPHPFLLPAETWETLQGTAALGALAPAAQDPHLLLLVGRYLRLVLGALLGSL